MDRFMFQMWFPTHTYAAMKRIIGYRNAAHAMKQIDKLELVMGLDDIEAAQKQVEENIALGDAERQIVAIYLCCCPDTDSRMPPGWRRPEIADSVLMGPGARALRDFMQAARGLIYLRGGAPMTMQAVKELARPVLRHRIILKRTLKPEYQGKPIHEQVDLFIGHAIEEAEKRWDKLPLW